MLLSFKPLPELVQSNFRLSIHKVVQNCSQKFARMQWNLSGKYDLSPQNSICFVYKLLNLFYFIKLTSISANAFTDSKFKVFMYDQASGKNAF